MNAEYISSSLPQSSPFAREMDFLPKIETKTNRPLTHGVTIDRRGSYDLDDAFSLGHIPGGILLSIHISDVASVVPKGTEFDNYARSRLTSRYSNHRCTEPMFPRAFTKKQLSLLPFERRPAVSITFPISFDMEIESPSVTLTSFKSSRRFDYADIRRVGADRTDPYRDYMNEASLLAYKLSRIRKNSSGIFNEKEWDREAWSPEQSFNGRAPENYGHGIINEFMLLANIGFLRFCYQNDIPILYRNHAIHAAAGDHILMLYRREKLSELKQANECVRIIYPEGGISLNPVGLGHFELDSLYGSFSSPIRKYSDLVNQRNTEAFCLRENIPYSTEELSELADYINAYR